MSGKFYQQLLRQQLVKAELKKKQQAKVLSLARKLLLTQPLILSNYVSPVEDWLKPKNSIWKNTLKELKKSTTAEEFKELVLKHVKLSSTRKAIWNYMR